MIIDLMKLSPEGETFTGADAPEVLDIDQDRFVHPAEPIRYDLFAQVVGQELIVRGSVNTTVKVLCGRCAGFFSTTLSVSSFLRAYSIREGVQSVDITEDLREELLVELPSFPSCSWDGKGICPYSGVNLEELQVPEEAPDESCWGALDQWKEASEKPGGPN